MIYFVSVHVSHYQVITQNYPPRNGTTPTLLVDRDSEVTHLSRVSPQPGPRVNGKACFLGTPPTVLFLIRNWTEAAASSDQQ